VENDYIIILQTNTTVLSSINNKFIDSL